MEEMQDNTTPEGTPVSMKWYEGVSLEDAEVFIHANLKSAARSVIAIGYYLKCVKEKELFEGAGFKDIYDYARDRFGFSSSTTSRYMKRNDKFSINGNSPLLDEKYKDFNKSQLQEMLGLDTEQLGQVTPDMTVVTIREMKKPKEIPYVHMPGQIELTDFPGVDPEDVAAAVQAREGMAASSPGKQAYTISAEDLLPDGAGPERPPIAISQQDSGPEVIHFAAGDRTIDGAYGATAAAVVRAYLDNGYDRPEKECAVTVLGMGYKVLKRPDFTAFYTDVGRYAFEVENARLEEEYQYWHRDRVGTGPVASQDNGPAAESQQGPGTVGQQTLPGKSGKCIHQPGYNCTLEENQKYIPGTGEDCGQTCCWECVKHGDCSLECYSSERRLEVVSEEHGGESAAEVQQEVEDAAEVQQETKDVHPEPALQRHPEKPEPGQERENIGGVPVFSMANRMTAEGAYGWKRSEIINGYLRALHREESYTIANKIIPIEFQVMGNTYKAKYDGCFYVSFKKGDQTFMFVELDRLKAEYALKYPPKKAKPVATYDKSILQSMIKFEQDQLDMMGPSWMEKQPYHYTKHMMALEAYRMLQAAHEGEENEGKVVG